MFSDIKLKKPKEYFQDKRALAKDVHEQTDLSFVCGFICLDYGLDILTKIFWQSENTHTSPPTSLPTDTFRAIITIRAITFCCVPS